MVGYEIVYYLTKLRSTGLSTADKIPVKFRTSKYMISFFYINQAVDRFVLTTILTKAMQKDKTHDTLKLSYSNLKFNLGFLSKIQSFYDFFVKERTNFRVARNHNVRKKVVSMNSYSLNKNNNDSFLSEFECML